MRTKLDSSQDACFVSQVVPLLSKGARRKILELSGAKGGNDDELIRLYVLSVASRNDVEIDIETSASLAARINKAPRLMFTEMHH